MKMRYGVIHGLWRVEVAIAMTMSDSGKTMICWPPNPSALN